METICTNCNFDLVNLEMNLHLQGAYHSIFCPVCGTCITGLAEFPGVFYDEDERTYVIWNLRPQRQAVESRDQKFGDHFLLTVEGKSIQPYDICYPKVVIFQHEDELVLPFTVVKPEYHRYLSPYARTSGQWNPPKFTFQPALRGDYTLKLKLDALLSQTKPSLQSNKFSHGTALNIWPNFRRSGWRNYFIYFVSTDPNVKVQSLRVIGEGREEKTFPGPVPRGEVNFVPAFIEISVTDSVGTDYWSAYKVEFKDNEVVQDPSVTNDNNELPLLALDFGTSNTCFAISLPEATSINVIEFRDRTKRLIKSLYVEDSINFTWFPEVLGEQRPNQLPSELIFTVEIDKIMGQELRDFQPIVNYTIPPFTRYRDGEEKYVLGEFKWERAFYDSHIQPYTFDLQYLYLTLALRLALAELISNPQCQRFDRVDLVATCPLAFSTTQREQFREVIGRVQRSIAHQTGIRLILRKIYDESHAGASGSGQMPGTTETIYVDVGGGTTDLGFFYFNERQEEDAIYLDSMQYAGNDVWRAITNGKLSDWPLIKFEREARFRNVKSIFDEQDLEPFKNQAKNMQRALRGVKSFVEGLIEFITRMIAAQENTRGAEKQSQEELGLYLLGNGWRFIEVLLEDDEDADVGAAIAAYVKRQVEARLNHYQITTATLDVRYALLNNMTPKTNVVVGAAILYTGEKLSKLMDEPEFKLQSFLGSDVAITAAGKHLVKWHETIPYVLTSTTSMSSVNYEKPPNFEFEADQVNGMKIHHINLLKPLLRKQGGRTCLGKNVFAYYLEEWHKNMLLEHP